MPKPMIFSLALVVAASASAAAQTGQRGNVSVPRLALVEEWRIDPRKEHVDQIGFISIAPDGRVIIAPGVGRGGPIMAFDSTGKTMLWQLPTGWNRDFEIRYVNRIGWTGAQLWISDPGYDQIALVDNHGKVTKSLEIPAFARPSLAERHKYPLFGSMDPLARYADGSMLVRPLREKNVFDTPEFDSTATHLLRVSASGIISGSMARYTPDASVSFPFPNGVVSRPVPLQNRTYWNVSPDGMRVAFVTAAMAGKDSATFGVVMLSERGDTVFSRRYPYVPLPMPAKSRDSALAENMRPIAGHPNAEIREALAKKMPPILPPVRGVFIGRDRTAWIGLNPAPRDTAYSRLILSPTGDVIGSIEVPRTTAILAADRDHVWASLREGTVAIAVVRYKLVPKK